MTVAAKKRQGIDWQDISDRLNRAITATTERHTPERVQAILQERARAAARVPAPTPLAGALLEVLRFTLAGEEYALETIYIREVLRPREITPLPGTPEFLAGIANLRGQIVAIFDVRRFFNPATPPAAELARVIVLGRERIEFGMLADAVHEVALLPIEQVKEPPGSVSGIAREYLRGVTAEALSVLDGAILLRDPRLYIDMGEDGEPESTEYTSPLSQQRI
jgi:purine-binding chemotaxis protein CheW